MLKLFFGLCFLSIGAAVCFPSVTRAQQSTRNLLSPHLPFPLNADNWSFPPGAVEFLPAAPVIDGVSSQGPAMKIIGRNARSGRCKKCSIFLKGSSTSIFSRRIRILHLFIFTARMRWRRNVFISAPAGLQVIPILWRVFNILR